MREMLNMRALFRRMEAEEPLPQIAPGALEKAIELQRRRQSQKTVSVEVRRWVPLRKVAESTKAAGYVLEAASVENDPAQRFATIAEAITPPALSETGSRLSSSSSAASEAGSSKDHGSDEPTRMRTDSPSTASTAPAAEDPMPMDVENNAQDPQMLKAAAANVADAVVAYTKTVLDEAASVASTAASPAVAEPAPTLASAKKMGKAKVTDIKQGVFNQLDIAAEQRKLAMLRQHAAKAYAVKLKLVMKRRAEDWSMGCSYPHPPPTSALASAEFKINAVMKNLMLVDAEFATFMIPVPVALDSMRAMEVELQD